MKVDDNLTVKQFIDKHYHQCFKSSYNVVSKRFKHYPIDTRKEMAFDLTHHCLEKMLTFKEIGNCGKVFHQLLKDQIRFDYSDRSGHPESIYKTFQKFQIPEETVQEPVYPLTTLDILGYSPVKQEMLYIIQAARQDFTLDENLVFEKLYIEGYTMRELCKHFGITMWFIRKIQNQILTKIKVHNK